MRPQALIAIVVLLALGYGGWQLWQAKPTPQTRTQSAPSKALDPSQVAQISTQAPLVGPTGKLPAKVEPQSSVAVRGLVIGPDHAPVAAAEVRLLRVLSISPDPRDVEIETLQTGEDGRFRFRTPLQHGLVIEVQAPQARAPAPIRAQRRNEGIFQVRPHPATTRLEVSPRLREQIVVLEHGFVVHGFLRERGSGTPMPDVVVELATGQFGREGGRSTRTNASGYFVFRGVPSGVVGLCAHDPRYAPVILPAITVGSPRPAWLGFREAGTTLHGRVVAAGSTTPVASARVTAHTLGMQQVVISETASDAKGEFKLSGLGTGRYSVVVRHAEWSTQRQVVVVGGEIANPVFELAPRVTIEGRLTGALPKVGVPLVLTCESGEVLRTVSEPDGRFKFAQKASVGASLLAIENDQHYFSIGARDSMGLQIEERSSGTREFAIQQGATLSGRVVDSTGNPVPSARIYSEQRLLWLVGSMRPIAECDAEGNFTITGLPPGQVPLVVAKEGYATRSLDVAGPEGGVAKTIEPIALELAGSIRGIVRRNSEPCAGAQVMLGKGDVLTVAGLDGRFVLRNVPPGTHELLARYSTLSKQKAPAPIEVRAGAEVGPIEITLPGGRSVTGEVVDLQDNPITDALIGIDGDFGGSVFTNPDGTFELEIPEGEVTLSAMTSDGEAVGFEDVGARTRKTRIVVPLPPRVTMTAKVLALPERRVVTYGILRVTPVEGGFEVPGISQILRTKRSILPRPVAMPGGALRVERFPVGKMRVLLHCPGYAPFEKVVQANAQQPFDLGTIQLEPGARIEGVVVEASGKPVAGARVLVGEESDLAFRRIASSGVVTDATGAFAIAGISQRSTRLVVTAPGFATRIVDLTLPRDLLRKEPLVVEMGRGSVVEVKLVDAAGAAIAKGAVLMLRDGMFVDEAIVGDDGVATFPHRAPGTYTVTFFNRDGESVPLEIDSEGKTFQVKLVRKAKK